MTGRSFLAHWRPCSRYSPGPGGRHTRLWRCARTRQGAQSVRRGPAGRGGRGT
jgi:hypothetical protein